MAAPLLLSSEEVSDLAPIEAYVDVVRDAYRERGEGAPATPPVSLIADTDPEVSHTNYKAILPEMGVMGGYDYSLLSDAWFVTPIFDTETAEPLAILDGAVMNPLKTGATGAVAVDELARDDASTVGIVGSGSQARGQLRAIATVRDLERASIYSRTRENRERTAADLDDELDVGVEAVSSAEEAVRDADIVVTATTASDPVFDGDLLAPGTHVNEVGSYGAEKRELDVTAIQRAKYLLDHRGRALEDAGSFIHALKANEITEDHLYGELGDVVAGNLPGRESDDEITVFDSAGTAIETVSAAYMLYQRAEAEGLGTRFPVSSMNETFEGKL